MQSDKCLQEALRLVTGPRAHDYGDKTVVKAKTTLTKNRVKTLEFDSISLKSPWVEALQTW